jgi:hypothetical protein
VPRKKLGVQLGDVLAGRLPDGRYGAVHVIRYMKDGHGRGRDSVLIASTSYLGESPPRIDDPTLRRLLRKKRFQFKDEPEFVWTEQPPPPDFVLVGNFPATEEELAIRPRGDYGSHWSILQAAYWEWRWDHDREALMREMEESRRRPPPKKASEDPGPRKRARGSTLTEEGFWGLIAKLDPDAGGAEPLVAELARLKTPDLREFEDILAEKLYRLDGRRYAEWAGDAGESNDAFLYARCYVVAKGRAFFEDVLRGPERFPADADFEELLSAASDAYARRTGKDLDPSTHFSYETGSNAAGWEKG